MTTCAARLASVAAIACLALAHPGEARAETSFMIGAGAAYMPEYEGSDEYEVAPAPLLNITWTNDGVKQQTEGYAFGLGLYDASFDIFKGIDVGVARIATPTGDIMFRPGVAYSMGRDADDSDALRGLGDIEGHALFTFAIAKEGLDGKPGGLRYGLDFATDVSDETSGSTIGLYLGYEYVVSRQLILSTEVSTEWADEDYMQSYFGITSAQAAGSVYNTYDAGSGFKDIGVSFGAKYSLTENWGLFGDASYTHLLGDAADSPLVDDEGSAGQFRLLTGVAYRF